MDAPAGPSSWSWLDDLGHDLRYAVRGLRRSPEFAATVALILALGIGANTAMFSIVYSVLLRPLPYPDAGAIVRIGDSFGPRSLSDMRLSNRSMLLLRGNTESLEQLAAYQEFSAEWDDSGGVSVRGARVSPSLFPLLRVTPHMGRLFMEEEARTGAERVVLLSHDSWTNRFASDPAIVGTTINFDSNPHVVVGVLAEGFYFPTPDGEFWMPYVIPPVGDILHGGLERTAVRVVQLHCYPTPGRDRYPHGTRCRARGDSHAGYWTGRGGCWHGRHHRDRHGGCVEPDTGEPSLRCRH